MRRTVRTAAAGLVPVAAFLLGACDGPRESQAARAETARTRPLGYIVDSILPPEEAMRRFRTGIQPVAALDGPTSREALLREFQRAAQSRDTATLRRLAVNRAEFAYLIYPEARIARPPYRQPPEIAWLLLQSPSDAGLRKLLGRLPEMSLGAARCADSAVVDGRLRFTSGCTVRVQTSAGERDMRLFGRIVELDGRWKIVTYNGDL